MTRKQAIARCKELTMGCWWSSSYYPKPRPRWDYIVNELKGLRDYPGVPTDLEQVIQFAEAQT